MSQAHPLARTTPRTRSEIRNSDASATALAQLYNISVATARKWKKRDDVLDRTHRAHDLGTTLSPVQSAFSPSIDAAQAAARTGYYGADATQGAARV